MTDYRVLPVKSKQVIPDAFKDIAKVGILPVHSFFMCIYSVPKSGKSNLIINILKNKDFHYQKRYDTIYYISPTLDSDKTCKCVMDDDEIIKIYEPDDITNIDNILNAILENQKEINKEESHSSLIIMDDMLGMLHGSSLITRICSKYRHYNTSFIVVSQAFKSLSPIIRQCASHWILFHTENRKELSKIEEEFAGFNNFRQIYEENTREKYSFIYIDINKQRIYRNFEELVYEK